MSTLPTIINHSKLNQSINARDLHRALEVGKHFGSWIQERIERYNLLENQDFILYPNSGKKYFGMGRPTKEYLLTLDIAKSIAMMENNARGAEIRQYFIGVEKKAKQLLPQLQAQNQQLIEAVLKHNPLYNNIVRYSQLGLNATEIAKLCDLSADRLRHHRATLAELNLIDPPAKKGSATKIRFTEQQLTDIYHRYQSGCSLSMLGRAYGCSKDTIRARIKAIESKRKNRSEVA